MTGKVELHCVWRNRLPVGSVIHVQPAFLRPRENDTYPPLTSQAILEVVIEVEANLARRGNDAFIGNARGRLDTPS